MQARLFATNFHLRKIATAFGSGELDHNGGQGRLVNK
jgi:hypothetical protein